MLFQPVSLPPISELGPDALMEPMTEDEFHNSLKKKKSLGIKALLLDQVFNVLSTMYECVECQGYKTMFTVLFYCIRNQLIHLSW